MTTKTFDRFCLKIVFFFILFSTLNVGSSWAESLIEKTVRGRVLLDEVVLGRTQSAGLKNVLVSNTKHVTTTNKDGFFELPLIEEGHIFVIKPTDYSFTKDDQGRPLFYHLHKPGKKLKFKYPTVHGKPLPEKIEFHLVKTPEPREFDILVFGDPQPADSKEVEYFSRAIVDEIENPAQFAFGISLGDIVFDRLELFEGVNRAVSKLGIPWYNVLGNHDMNYRSYFLKNLPVEKRDLYSDETFEKTFGPSTYAFSYGGVHFIILDNIIYPYKDGSSSSQNYIGGIRDDQRVFLQNYLAHIPKDQLVVMNMHAPLVEEKKLLKDFRGDDRAFILGLLSQFENSLSMSAHTHIQKHVFVKKHEGLGWSREQDHHHFNVGTASGSWWHGRKDSRGIPDAMMMDGTPNGWATVHFKGNTYQTNYHPRGQNKGNWAHVRLKSVHDMTVDMYVNAYQASEKSKLYYRFDEESDWVEMTEKVTEYDPFYRFKFDDIINDIFNVEKPLPPPIKSTHLWKSRIELPLVFMFGQVEIRMDDMFGRSLLQTVVFEKRSAS